MHCKLITGFAVQLLYRIDNRLRKKQVRLRKWDCMKDEILI